MPQPSKQTPPQQAKPTTTTPTKAAKPKSIRDRIAPIEVKEGIKFAIYGQIRSGKTTFAATFPKPLLLLGTEDGTKSISDVKGIDFLKLQSSADMDDVAEILAEGKYKSVAMDTVKGFEDICYMEVLGLAEIPLAKSWGLDIRIWGAVASLWKEKVSKLFRLTDSMGLNVVLIAHERSMLKEDQPIIPGIAYMGCLAIPAIGSWLNNECDFVAHSYRRGKTVLKEEVAAGKKVIRTVKVPGEDYCLRIGYNDVYITGVRKPRSVKMDEIMVDPTYEKFLAMLHGKSPK